MIAEGRGCRSALVFMQLNPLENKSTHCAVRQVGGAWAMRCKRALGFFPGKVRPSSDYLLGGNACCANLVCAQIGDIETLKKSLGFVW
jgi:hypothetical protein